MLPLLAGVTQGVVFTTLVLITILMLLQGLVAVSVTCVLPRQPFEFFAVTV